jgi:ligand-binding sensor domain-containing protein
MWFGTPDGLSSFSNGQWRAYRVQDGLPSDSVNCLLQDSTGAIWIGTGKGLSFSRMERSRDRRIYPASGVNQYWDSQKTERDGFGLQVQIACCESIATNW